MTHKNKMTVDILIKESDKNLLHAIEDADLSSIITDDNKFSSFKIGDKITFNLNGGGQYSCKIKDIKFMTSKPNKAFIIEVFV